MMKLQSKAFISSILGMAIGPGIAAAVSNSSSEIDDKQIDYSGPNPTELFGQLIWVIVSLAIVIALIVLVIKWLSQRNRSWGSNRTLRSLGGVALGQNSSLQVLEIADRIYIVGVGENVTLIDKLDDPEQVAAVLTALERQSDKDWSTNPLSQLINKLRNRQSPNGPEPDHKMWDNPSSFEHLLQSKLDQQADRKQQMESLLQQSKSNERLMDNEK